MSKIREDCCPAADFLPHWPQSHLCFSVRLPPSLQHWNNPPCTWPRQRFCSDSLRFLCHHWHNWPVYTSQQTQHMYDSLVLHSPGFLLIWQIEHDQSSSIIMTRKFLAFPVVYHRVLRWAQFSSSSAQNLFLTWFGVTLSSLSLLRMILCPKSLSLHHTFNLRYLLWKPVSQTFRTTGCWKQTETKQ